VNKNELVSIWRPIESMPNELLDLQYLNFEGDTLTIILSGKNKGYKFKFHDMIVGMGSYKYTSLNSNFEFSETFKTWINICHLGSEVYSLFRKFDSFYIDCIKTQSYNAYKDVYHKITHYIFVTCDAVIEVVSMYEPVCIEISI